MRRFQLVTILLPIAALSQNNNPPGTCYYPGGAVAQGHTPCDKDAFITQCCPSGWTCFSNSLCVVTDPRSANAAIPIASTIRGSCTNPLWNNAICGDFCLAAEDQTGEMNACGQDTFCCAGEEKAGVCNCGTKAGIVSVLPGRVQTVIGLSGSVAVETPIFTSRVSSSTTTTTAITTKSTGTASPTVTSTANKKITQTTAFKAGIGAAGGVLFLVIIGVVACIFKTRSGSSEEEYQTSSAMVAQPYIMPAEYTRPSANGSSQNHRSGGLMSGGLSTADYASGDRATSPTNPFESGGTSRTSNRLSVPHAGGGGSSITSSG